VGRRITSALLKTELAQASGVVEKGGLEELEAFLLHRTQVVHILQGIMSVLDGVGNGVGTDSLSLKSFNLSFPGGEDVVESGVNQPSGGSVPVDSLLLSLDVVGEVHHHLETTNPRVEGGKEAPVSKARRRRV